MTEPGQIRTHRLAAGDKALARSLFALMAAVFDEPSEPLSAHYLDRLLSRESAARAVQALDTLGEKQKLTVLLRIFHDLPYPEIGRIIGCTAQTAKVHFHYGIENLRKKLMPHEL